MNWKVIHLEKFRNILLHVYWRKEVVKSSNTFDQLLIYWKAPISRNNLQVYNVRFLICLFKLSSIPLSRVIIIAILFLQWIFVPANIKNLDFQFVQKRNSLPPLYKVIQANKVNYAWLQTMDVCRCGHLRKQMWHIPRKEWNSINRS